MQKGNVEDPKDRHAAMPPVSTTPLSDGQHTGGEGRMAPPFVGVPTVGQSSNGSLPSTAADIPSDGSDMSWDELAEEGTVEPAFEADVSATSAALAAIGEAHGRTDGEFPLDAFIIPEHTQRLPSGLEGQPASENAHTPLTDLADRLEKLSHRLRVEKADAVMGRMASGDKIDAMLAGLLGGFLAGTR